MIAGRLQQGGNERPVIYGRERERARLRELLDGAIVGRGSLVLISGEAGIGKTSLVNDLIHKAEQRDCLILTGGCYDLTTTPPYGPWIEALREYRPPQDGLALPPWLNDPEDVENVSSQAAFFDETLCFMTDIAEEQLLLIALEDLHWSDSASLELLRYLARHLEHDRILLVATYRDDELSRRHQLYELLPLLVRESRAERFHLGRLDRSTVVEMARTIYALDDADTARLVDFLWQRSDGNPLFVRELLVGLEENALVSTLDSWALGDLETLRVPALLRQVIEIRLRILRPETRTALQVAAVIGQEVSLALWQTVAALTDAELDEVVEEALRARVLEETLDNPEFRFHHALVRESLYTSLIVTQRRRWHRRVGEALITLGQPNPDAVAHHFEQAGDPRAAGWLIRAAVRAEGRYAMWMAADIYQRALAVMEADPETANLQGWIHLQIAYLLLWKEMEVTLPHLEEAQQLADLVDDPVLAAYSLHLHGVIRHMRGQEQAGDAEMRAAIGAMNELSLADEERARQVLIAHFPDHVFRDPRATSGGLLFQVGALPGVHTPRQLNIQALADAGHYSDAIDEGRAHIATVSAATNDALTIAYFCRFAYEGLALAADALGHPARARQWRMKALEAHETLAEHGLVAQRLWGQLEHALFYQTEQVSERRRIARAALNAGRLAMSHQGPESRPPPYELPLDLLEGRWGQARAAALDLSGYGHVTNSLKFRAAALVGREQADEELIDLAMDVVSRTFPDGLNEDPGVVLFDIGVAAQRLNALLALDAGDLERAEAWLRMQERWLDWSGAVLWRSECELLWARCYVLHGDLTSAQLHTNRALEYASEPRQPLALTAAQRMRGEIATRENRLAEATEWLEAALDLAEACEAVYEIALTHLAQAELAIAKDEIGLAKDLLALVREIGESLNARLTLARVETLEQVLATQAETYPSGLSPREVEVLQLVAQGMTDAEAAEQLFLSPRTVSSYLSSVYNKLGVNSRTAAVARWAELVHQLGNSDG